MWFYPGAAVCKVLPPPHSDKWTEVWFEELKLGEINPDTLQIQIIMPDYKT